MHDVKQKPVAVCGGKVKLQCYCLNWEFPNYVLNSLERQIGLYLCAALRHTILAKLLLGAAKGPGGADFIPKPKEITKTYSCLKIYCFPNSPAAGDIY